MRLSPEEISHIIEGINHHLKLSGAELRLFGSRVNDFAKGGDIDLLLVLPNLQSYQQALDQKINILVNLKQSLGDQKIDLVLATPEFIPEDPFLDMIYEKAIVLHTWL